MIYLTGDTHGDFRRFTKKNFRNKNIVLTERDYVLVVGDFGLCWEKDGTFTYNINNFKEKTYTILWIQGNHENYDFIKEFPLEEWKGGKVRHIERDKVILLERGQVFNIDGEKIFTFGGASSHDVQGGIFEKEDPDLKSKIKQARKSGLPFRVNHESWWKEELPNEEEMKEGLRNLEAVDFKVDYVLTHCAPTYLQLRLELGKDLRYQGDVLTDYLEKLEKKLSYKNWYFGHYHSDEQVTEKHTLLYRKILKLGERIKADDYTPTLGKPRFHYKDRVKFMFNGEWKEGVIEIIDAYGTFGQSEEPSYDIFSDGCLYKHYEESSLIRLTDEV